MKSKKKGTSNMIPFQPPADGEYTAVLTEGQILMTRRLQLGLTQAQVAKMAGLYVRQYQRLEIMGLSDCTMRIGLTICSVLFLNPIELVPPRVNPLHQLGLFEDLDQPRVGRKNTFRHMMQLDITSGKIIVPEQVISALGSPKYVRYRWDKARILLSAASNAASRCVFPVTEGEATVIPAEDLGKDRTVKCCLVQDRNGRLFVLSQEVL